MKQKKIPIRKCIGCNQQKPKKEFIRIVKNKQNQIFIDFTSKANGRGAYICNDIECLKKVRKKRALDRAFETSISDEIFISLEKELLNEK